MEQDTGLEPAAYCLGSSYTWRIYDVFIVFVVFSLDYD